MQIRTLALSALALLSACSGTVLAQAGSQRFTLTDNDRSTTPAIVSSAIIQEQQAEPQPEPQAQPAQDATQQATTQPAADGSNCCPQTDCCETNGLRGCRSSGCCDHSLFGGYGRGQGNPWNFGGWTQAGYTNNNIPLSQAYNDLLSFNDVPDHFHLNQQWFFAERDVDRPCGWGLGGRVDVAYGTDAQKIQAFGNPNAGVRGFGTYDASLDHGEYGWAVPQLYAEIANVNWSFKIGKWFSPAGYERIPSPENFFYTHSYTHFNSQAFSHSGILGEFNGFQDLTWYTGWAAGWDTGFDQLNQGNCYVGGFKAVLTPQTTFSLINTYGNFGWRDGGDDNSRQHSFVLVHDVSCRLQVVLQSDIIDTSNPGVSEFDAVGLTNYIYYRMTENIRVGSRYEWWKADGVSFNEATLGLNVCLLENLIFRPEVRRDWAPGIGLDEITQVSADFIWSY